MFRNPLRCSRFLGLATAGVLAVAPAAGAMPVRSGDTPADFPGMPSRVVATKIGDTPADFPGASRAPQAPPTVVTIERPSTLVDDGDDVLPVVLSGAALLVALGGAGYSVARRPRVATRASN